MARMIASEEFAEAERFFLRVVLPRSILIAIMPIRTQKYPTMRSKCVLIVLFVPSVQRDGATPIDQHRWVGAALEMFATVFGGATAYPKARGVWRDDDRDGALVFDEPVVVHCYVTTEAVHANKNLDMLGEFCRHMGRETNQGEVGLIIDGEYLAFRDFGD